MAKHKVALMGNKAVGKTSLVCRLKGWGFSPQYEATIGADSVQVDVLSICDIAGDERYRSLHGTFLENSEIVLYCVDLSTLTEPNIKEIKQKIEEIKSVVPKATVILVATKCDTYTNIAQLDLEKIGRDVGSDANIITSALNEYGITSGMQTLMNLILTNALKETAPRRDTSVPLEQPPAMIASLISEEIKNNLLSRLGDSHANRKQRKQIKAALVTLNRCLEEDNTQFVVATRDFVTNCHIILEGNYPNIMSAAYTLAGAVVVAGIIALAGIGFGVAALTLSISSCLGGCAAAGLLANSIFKERAYVVDVLDTFSAEIDTQFSSAI